jgi:hypothetical protein
VVLEKMRDLAAIGAVALAVVVLLVWIAGALAGGSFGVPKALIEALASMYTITRAWAEQYATALGVVGLMGGVVTLFMASRHARRRISEAWIAKATEVRARLTASPAEISAAAEDQELQPAVERLTHLVNLLSQHDNAPAEATLTGDQLDQIRNEISDVLSILAIEMARKELKFDAIIATPTAEEQIASATVRQRLARVLASERFCKDLGLIKKPLSYVAMGLLFVSLIGWTAEPMANSLQLAVNNLRVNVLLNEADRNLDAALSAAKKARVESPQPDTIPPNAVALQTTTRMLAQAAGRELVRSRIIDQLANVERTALSEAEFVRASIAEQRIDVPAHADPVTRVRGEVAESIAKDAHDTAGMARIQQHLERELRPHAERLQRESPNLFARMGANLEARYGAPMSPLDAQGNLIARMVDEALGGIDIHPSTELSKQGQKLVKEFGKEAIKTWVDTVARNYAADSIIDAARGGVLTQARADFRFESSSEARQFAHELHAAEGSRWSGSVAAREEYRLSQAVASKVASNAGADPIMQGVISERLGGYDNLFPSGGGGGGGSEVKGKVHGPASGRAYVQSRATNFHIASRSFRVRGVLIGQDQSSQGLDIRDIRWTLRPATATDPARVRLEIQVGAQWVDLGSFDAAVVNQALRYAADRRVVATTITPGDGRVIGRVTYLHPVLADTPLGCRVVEADRLVDTFSSATQRSPGASRLAELTADREQMRRWMATVSLAETVASIPSRRACPLDEVERVVQGRKLGSVQFSPAVGGAIERFLANEEQKKPGTTNFLRNAHACATGASGAIAACLCSRVRNGGLGDQYWFPEDHTSQFRERQVTLGPDMQWIKRSEDHLAHVDLWVHTTLALRTPTSSGEGSGADEATATTVDFPTEQLFSLRSVISENLPRYLAEKLKSPTYDDFMMPLEDFVLLQRLMRAALAGNLGRGFPVTKLIKLERTTRQYVPYQPTIRWEAANTEGSLSKTLSEADPKAAKIYLAWEADRNIKLTSRKPVCDRASN